MKQHLLSTGTKHLAEASPLTPGGTSVFGLTTSGLATPAGGKGFFSRKRSFYRPRRHSHNPLINCAPRPSATEFMIFPQHRLALWLWSALTQVFLRIFRLIFRTRRRTTVPRGWLLRLASTPPSCCQNTAPVLSAAPLLSTTLPLPSKLRFIAELTLSPLGFRGGPRHWFLTDHHIRRVDRMISVGAASTVCERN